MNCVESETNIITFGYQKSWYGLQKPPWSEPKQALFGLHVCTITQVIVYSHRVLTFYSSQYYYSPCGVLNSIIDVRVDQQSYKDANWSMYVNIKIIIAEALVYFVDLGSGTKFGTIFVLDLVLNLPENLIKLL